jgi:hypothetical protein
MNKIANAQEKKAKNYRNARFIDLKAGHQSTVLWVKNGILSSRITIIYVNKIQNELIYERYNDNSLMKAERFNKLKIRNH